MIDKKKNNKIRDQYIGIGLALGVAFGAALNNVGLGIGIGLAIGAAIGSTKQKEQDASGTDAKIS
jgi:F0F1-type ATP synthase membrane subunit c/vacuolar-type H+-ATPase subunit K